MLIFGFANFRLAPNSQDRYCCVSLNARPNFLTLARQYKQVTLSPQQRQQLWSDYFIITSISRYSELQYRYWTWKRSLVDWCEIILFSIPCILADSTDQRYTHTHTHLKVWMTLKLELNNSQTGKNRIITKSVAVDGPPVPVLLTPQLTAG